MMGGIIERQGQALFHTTRAPAAVIEVQVRQNDVGDVIGMKPGFGQRTMQVVFFVVDRIDLPEPGRSLVPEAVINQNQPVVAFQKQAPHVQGNAVPGVGRDGAFPERFRHDAEHGPPVEFEAAGFDGMQGVWSNDWHGAFFKINGTGQVTSEAGGKSRICPLDRTSFRNRSIF